MSEKLPTETVKPAAGWHRTETPFHQGELAIQARYGVSERTDAFARRMIFDHMPDSHRAFLAKVPFILAGTINPEGQLWATVLSGPPGFVRADNDRQLAIAVAPAFNDPAAAGVFPGSSVGLLAIEFATRERYRTNGTISAVTPAGLIVDVDMSYANCPQYVQARSHEQISVTTTDQDGGVRSDRLAPAMRGLVEAADTFFLASARVAAPGEPGGGVDISHRGGKPGFVRIDDDRTLTMPDFVGNMMFNTLGNLSVDGRAGLLFVDFSTGDVLQLLARAEIIWDGPEVKAFAAAERLVRFHVAEAVYRRSVLPFRWSAPSLSPVLRRTGSWADAAKALEAEQVREKWRPFVVTDVKEESTTIRSFVLAPDDGGGVVNYEPGQHLPIRIALGDGRTETRNYTLSAAPNGESYRISVKSDGAVSSWLHALTGPGAHIEAKAPRGSFHYRESSRPAVLISAGIGVTPMIALLDALLVNLGRTRHFAPIIFIHGARNRAEQAFAEMVGAKAKLHPNMTLHVRYSRPSAEDIPGEDYHSEGRIDPDLVARLRPAEDCDFYLCGPTAFMQMLYDGLRAQGVPDGRIQMEAFGPASVRRKVEAAAAVAPIEVRFAKSGRRAMWQPSAGSLLDFAEAQGLKPASRCRMGSCGTCVTRVIEGDVDYEQMPVADVPEGSALICCGTPRPAINADEIGNGWITLDL